MFLEEPILFKTKKLSYTMEHSATFSASVILQGIDIGVVKSRSLDGDAELGFRPSGRLKCIPFEDVFSLRRKQRFFADPSHCPTIKRCFSVALVKDKN